MVAEALGFVAGLAEPPGFKGRGGGARSGSELSHLDFPKIEVSFINSKDPEDQGKKGSEFGRIEVRTWEPMTGQSLKMMVDV